MERVLEGFRKSPLGLTLAEGGLRFILPVAMSVLLLLTLPSASQAGIGVFVSILPQKHFVERVGGGAVEVSVLVPPGRSPETYEPTPQQMVQLADSEIYFRIGVPFEDRWINKIRRLNPRLKIVDLRAGIELREVEPTTVDDHPGESDIRHAHTGKDPHIWMNPLMVSRMAVVIRKVLGDHEVNLLSELETNCARFIQELEALDREIRNRLGGVRLRDIYVYHPALGYFADAYGLRQVAVERFGREPGPRTLQSLVEAARRDGVRALLVQRQQGSRTVEAIASAMGVRIVYFDPLAENYVENLRSLGMILQEVLS